MRSRSLAAIAVLGMGAALALANLWFAGARSLIPLALEDRVRSREVRFEKHPGVDDVYLVTFDSGDEMQVDKPVYHRLIPAAFVQKTSWEKTVTIDGRDENLWWSLDMKRLCVVMPVILACMTLMAWLAARR